MNYLMGIVLLAAGVVLLASSRHLVDLLSGGSHWFNGADHATSRENLVIIAVMMVVSGLAFFVL
ncbi:MAG TPA: hypothetical protein VNA22_04815 [Pyrinomonadaceae bacterium]|nr:hypothetical protein [Pyrinomonadaceae bacterium]